MVTVLDPAIEFLRAFGFFSIILPFLLIFTLIFAILEKTKVLGQEDGKSKKNLNAIIAFVIGLLVVATANIVEIINDTLPKVVLLLVISVSFLILIGTFWASGELDFRKEHKGWYAFFMIIFFIAIIGIFLQAIKTDGDSVLEIIFGYVVTNFGGAVIGGLIMLVVIIAAIWLVVRGKEEEKGGKK